MGYIIYNIIFQISNISKKKKEKKKKKTIQATKALV